MQHLKNLKLILCSKLFTVILLIITIIYLLIVYRFKEPISKYEEKEQYITGTIIQKKETDTKITLTIKAKEKIQAVYYKKEEIPKFKLGDKITIKGKISYPSSNTNFYLFNYKNYLKSLKIYSLVTIDEYKIIKLNKNIFYEIKNSLIKYFDSFQSKNYLMAFLLGDTSLINENVKTSYQNNGISHLFAVSGMHITLFVKIISKLFKKFIKKENIFLLLITFFLCFYSFLASFSPSILRGCGSYILNELRKKMSWNCSSIQIILFLFCLFLWINPYMFYHSGFLFSFVVSFSLILFQKQIASKNYLKSLFWVSFVAFFASFPISINLSFQINLLSIFLNLIFVPFVSLFIFPFTLLTAVLPILDYILVFFVSILENISLFFSNISNFTIIMPRVSLGIIFIYYILIYLFLYNLFNKKYKYFVILVLFMICHYYFPYFRWYPVITMFDVNQGDSILIQLPHQKGNILIDTGGIRSYNDSYVSNLAEKTLLPMMKAYGIHKLDFLLLSHGDYDHMGEAISLVENFKVEKVIFNCGEFNDLEQDLIKVLDKKKIPYYSCIKELNIDDNKLYFLNNKDYGNENDNSSVVYTEFNNHKFLFMGDAGVEVEEDLIERYNLQDIDVLKVGHHGSKTSSGKEFINEINPKYSIISVGKNNRYGHPNKEVLNVLEDSKIYRTDDDGSIMFKIKNNKLQIETCTP